MLLRQRIRDFFHLLKIYFAIFLLITQEYVHQYMVGFVLTKDGFRRACLCTRVELNPWGLEGHSRFELSYTKATRRHLCQLDVVFVVVLDY